MADSSLPWGAVPFPSGDNETDTEIAGSHFNLTTLEEWKYSLFSNRTLSNGSSCVLVFDRFTPTYLFPNGTFQNKTNCWTPLHHIGPRAKTGIGFAVPFCLALLLTLACLRRHGKRYLPVEKRFFPISRRWQWYWAVWACTMALISLFTNVDVDRYYIIEVPIILTSFFWYLMQQGVLALVWEAVRHWGSWQERQLVDPDPFMLRDDDRRSKFEFWIPIWFYMWLWINFFLVIPRNWSSIKLQRSPEQVLVRAEPTATDARFKAGAFCLLVCWITAVVSLAHSIKHYKPKHPTMVSRMVGFFRAVPLRLFLIISLALVVVGFQVAVAFHFDISPLNVKGIVAAIYAGGYLPTLLIVAVQCAYGFSSPNEDRELIRQRRARGEEADRELGIVYKPSWWRRLVGNNQSKSMKDIIARNAQEVSGKKAAEQGMNDTNTNPSTSTSDRNDGTRVMEMTSLQTPTIESPLERPPARAVDVSRPQALSVYSGKSDRRRTERAMQHAAGLLFPNSEARADREAELMKDGPPPPYEISTSTSRQTQPVRPADSQGGSNSNSGVPSREGEVVIEEDARGMGGVPNAPSQRIRSMLDI